MNGSNLPLFETTPASTLGEGEQLVHRIEAWLASWVCFASPDHAFVCALWALNTWVFRRFDATPYLAITAPTKRAGKTTLLELLSMLSDTPEMLAAATAPTVYRLLREYDGRCSLFFDEAETMSREAGTMMKALMNVGYRRGQYVSRTNRFGGVDRFPVYSPKAFALIGDPNETLKDRCIILTMRRGMPKRPFQHSVAMREAQEIQREIEAYLPTLSENLTVEIPSWQEHREQEIWTPLVSVAGAMKLSAASLRRLKVASAAMSAAKFHVRPCRRRIDEEHCASSLAASERLVRDLRGVFDEGVSSVWTVEALERLKSDPAGRWKLFGEDGLTEISMSALLRRFNVRPRLLRRGQLIRRGYRRRDVERAVRELE